MLIAPIVEQVQVIAAPPKLVLWKWMFEAQPCADCDDETLSFQPLGMLAAEYWNPPLHPLVFDTVQVSRGAGHVGTVEVGRDQRAGIGHDAGLRIGEALRRAAARDPERPRERV